MVALPPPAAVVLARQPRIEGVPWVFPGQGHKGPLVGLQKVWGAVRAAAGLDDLRVHDLRHAFASVAVASGESLYITGKLLGHARPETTARYAHLADDPVQAAAGRVAGRLADALARDRRRPRRRRNEQISEEKDLAIPGTRYGHRRSARRQSEG